LDAVSGQAASLDPASAWNCPENPASAGFSVFSKRGGAAFRASSKSKPMATSGRSLPLARNGLRNGFSQARARSQS
ncbi:hypothetical protein, partial [Mesorhizobium sp.]|uniref:hypothetical protein n=1 Tax=Mesorhizobium sp. TaxID=1871066 RepID=UPI0025F276AF